MGRLIVLCLIFLSVIFLPANASAIFGEVWSTDAYNSALDPFIGPPYAKPDATFDVESINFNSQAKNVSFDEFLNFPDWITPSGSEFGKKKMFENNGQGNGDEGIFFRFTWELYLSPGSLPVTIVHDDGFFLRFSTGQSVNSPGQFQEPQISKFDLAVPSPGNYTVILNYGALNDTDSHVLIFRTPEPGSMLLFALGIVGLGVLRRRH